MLCDSVMSKVEVSPVRIVVACKFTSFQASPA
jgi:hypothetical protein